MAKITFAPKVRNEEAMKDLRAIADTVPALSPAARIDRAAATIVSEMTAIYGRQFRADVDHQHQIVLVRPC